MNTPLIAAWVSAVIGLGVMPLLMYCSQTLMDWMSHVLITLVSALFLANPVLLERGARQSPNNVRRISAWVMSTFLLLTSMFFSGILILILRLLA